MVALFMARVSLKSVSSVPGIWHDCPSAMAIFTVEENTILLTLFSFITSNRHIMPYTLL
ncbi:hypothetical protein FAGKG844_890003 [Frankia sp. AgKG'84/4]